ncbi:MAG: hypothetical protein BUE48_005555 [Thermomonospora sp. CIF 1]|nr:MAG: hypothetical protein BUE48_005555 [Thermomonospora sp. CIF 1]
MAARIRLAVQYWSVELAETSLTVWTTTSLDEGALALLAVAVLSGPAAANATLAVAAAVPMTAAEMAMRGAERRKLLPSV